MVQCSVCTEMFVRWEAYLSRLWQTLPQKWLSGEKNSCPNCGTLVHRKVFQVRSLIVPVVANVSVGAGFPATPFRPLGEHGPVLCLHRNVCQVRSLTVPIVVKRSGPDWVSSNTVLSTWGAWSSSLSAQKCLSGEKLTCPDCDKLLTRPQKCLSGEKLSCPDCGKRFDPDWVSSNTVLSTWGAWSSALAAPELFVRWSLAVLIVAKIYTWTFRFVFFWSKIAVCLSLGTPKGRPSYRRSLQPREHPALQNMKILYFFLFLWIIFFLLDPDPVPTAQVNADPQPCFWQYIVGTPYYGETWPGLSQS